MADVTVCFSPCFCLYRRSRYRQLNIWDSCRGGFCGDTKPPRPTQVHVGEPHAKHGWLLLATSPESVRSIVPIDPQVWRSRTSMTIAICRSKQKFIEIQTLFLDIAYRTVCICGHAKHYWDYVNESISFFPLAHFFRFLLSHHTTMSKQSIDR